MKKFLTLLMVVAMLFSMTACGGPSFEEQVANAIPVFADEEGQTFFTENKDQFEVVSGDEISGIVLGKSIWDVVKKDDVSRWEGKYEFERDGDIRETIYDGSVGYFNQKTWKVSGDAMIIKWVVTSGPKSGTYEMRKINDSTYVLYEGDRPSTLLY